MPQAAAKYPVGTRVTVRRAMHWSGKKGVVAETRVRKRDGSVAYTIAIDGGGQVMVSEGQLDFGRLDVTRNFKRERRYAPSACAKGSFRAKKTKNGTLLTFCCPRQKWKRGRCAVGMKLQSVGRPR